MIFSSRIFFILIKKTLELPPPVVYPENYTLPPGHFISSLPDMGFLDPRLRRNDTQYALTGKKGFGSQMLGMGRGLSLSRACQASRRTRRSLTLVLKTGCMFVILAVERQRQASHASQPDPWALDSVRDSVSKNKVGSEGDAWHWPLTSTRMWL